MVELHVRELLRVRVLRHAIAVRAAIIGLAINLRTLADVETTVHLILIILRVRGRLVAGAVGVRAGRHRSCWNASNHIVPERILLVLRPAPCIEEASTQILASLTIGIEL